MGTQALNQLNRTLNLVEPGGIEPPTSCMPCELNLFPNPLIQLANRT